MYCKVLWWDCHEPLIRITTNAGRRESEVKICIRTYSDSIVSIHQGAGGIEDYSKVTQKLTAPASLQRNTMPDVLKAISDYNHSHSVLSLENLCMGANQQDFAGSWLAWAACPQPC